MATKPATSLVITTHQNMVTLDRLVFLLLPNAKPQAGHAHIGHRAQQGQRLAAHPVAPQHGVEHRGQRGPEGALAQLQRARVQVRGQAEFEEFTEDLAGSRWKRM